MKTLFWILLAANLVVFAYFKHDASLQGVSTLKPEIHPEQITLLSPQALATYPKREAAPAPVIAEVTTETAQPLTTPALPPVEAKPQEAKTKEAKTPEGKTADSKAVESKTEDNKPAEKAASAKPSEATACYEWSGFSMSRASEAASLAQVLNIKTQMHMTSTTQDNVRYWIYKPPLASAEAAQTKAEELRKLGVEDFFIVQEDPKWRNAISFGVFRDEKLADKLMDDLKNKGVKLVIKATRNGGQASVKLQQVTPQQYASLQKSRSHFPDSVLKEIACQ